MFEQHRPRPCLVVSRPEMGPGKAQLKQALGMQWRRTPGTWLTLLLRAKAPMTFRCQSFESRFMFINTNVTQSRASWCEGTRFCASIGPCALSPLSLWQSNASVFPREWSWAAGSCIAFFLLTYTANYCRSAEVWYLINVQQFIWTFKPLDT